MSVEMSTLQCAEPPQQLIPGHRVVDLLVRLPLLGEVMTIVIHEGCVFEFKGVFPEGESGEGYYNLNPGGKGFQGHLRLDRLERVVLVSRQHRGRTAHAFVFENRDGDAIVKVFLGRDANGDIVASQLKAFENIRGEIARGDWL